MRRFIFTLLALSIGLAVGARAQGVNPRVFAPTPPSGVTLELQAFATLPTFNGGAARVQFLTAAPDGSTDLMVTDENGIIFRVSADGSSVKPYLDLTKQGVSLINGGQEEGLVGLAFHPNFNGGSGTPGRGVFYTAFSAALHSGTPDFDASQDSDHDQVIEEWTATTPGAAVFSGTHREVLRVGKYASNHNGGVIAFNPNVAPGNHDYGMLYIGFGDGGAGNDPNNNGQDVTSALGKILRINPMAGAGGAKYSAPADNPFPTGTGAAPLVWAYGLRNPQQFSFEHGPNGRLFIDDIGQLQVEEVNLGVKGGNYGWQVREGTFATGTGAGVANSKNVYSSFPLPAGDGGARYIYPIAQFDHVDPDTGDVVNAAIGSGYAYRGTAVPGLKGLYVFTDFAQCRMFAITTAYGLSQRARQVMTIEMQYDGASYGTLTGSPLGANGRPDLRLGEDAHGELYALVKGAGAVLRLVAP